MPGGHLEMYESWSDCAAREVLEEMNLIITNIKFGHVTNDIMEQEQKHYVTIFMMAECQELVPKGTSTTTTQQEQPQYQQPQNMEPHKCEGWKSFTWNELEEIHRQQQQQQKEGGNETNPKISIRLFGPLQKLVEEKPQAVLDFLEA